MAYASSWSGRLPETNDFGGGPRILSSGEEVKRAFRTRHKTHEPMQNARACVTESGMYDMARARVRILRVNLLSYYATWARGRCIKNGAWPR